MGKISKENFKVLFMGTPDFAVASIKAIVDAKYNVVGVFTNPDTEQGRGLKLSASEVKKYATEHNIYVYQPKKLRNNEEVMEVLKRLSPDIICVTAYGKILPKEVLDFPKYGCINVHGSLLPKYRGAAPMQWSLINGDPSTGITTMYMDVGMDTGDMLLKEEIPLFDEDDFYSVHEKLKVIGGELLVKTLDKILEDGKIDRIKQDNELATIAPMITKDMVKIDFSKEAKTLHNLTRGVSPYLGTYFVFNSLRYKVYKTSYEEANENVGDNKKIGEVINIDKNSLDVVCQKGILKIFVIQPEGSKKMDILSFSNSGKIKVGDILN